MWRLCLVCVLLVGLCLPAVAADSTYELLSAPHIRDTMQLSLTQDNKKFLFRKDKDARPGKDFRDLTDNETFVIDGQVGLIFHGFNPFEVAITTSEKSEDDPNFGGLSKFLDAAEKIGKQITPAGGGAGGTEADSITTHSQNLALLSQTPQGACDNYDKIHENLVELKRVIGQTFLDAQTFKKWKDGATSAQGVVNAQQGIDSKVVELGNLQKAMDDLLTQLGKLADLGQNKAEAKCMTGFRPSTFALATDVSRRLNQVIDLRRDIKARLEALSKYLKSFEEPTSWVDTGEYTFLRPQVQFAKVNVVTISVKRRSFNDTTFEVTEGDAATIKIRLRLHSVFVPEVGAAVVTTDVEFPKYGTAQQNGMTVVSDAGKERGAIKGALMLNMTFRLPYDSFVYPGIQLGLTQAEKYPGILLGPQLRFTRPRPLSISGGWLFAWYKGLNNLKVGDPVTGTADIEKDLTYQRARTAYYLSIQYNF